MGTDSSKRAHALDDSDSNKGTHTVNFRLLAMDTSMHTQKPCSGGTKELIQNHIVYIPTNNPLNTLSWLLLAL
jgi:hypothetical protein